MARAASPPAIAAAALVLLAAALPVRAQAPQGSEFAVSNTGDALGLPADERPRSSAMARDGGFVITWSRWRYPSNGDVMARRFDAGGGALGPPFVVNTYTTGPQYGEAIGMDDAGRFVIVWWGAGPGGTSGVSGQRFAASGAPLGGEFVIGVPGDARPSIAAAPAGEFVVVWVAPDGDSSGIFGQRYDAAGAPAGPRFQVNTYTTGQQYGPTVDVDAAGDFVVVWTTLTGVAGGVGPVGQRFAAAGVPQGAEFEVRPPGATGQATRARVARGPSGPFAVVWSGGTGPGIYARRFDADGLPLGGELQVNTSTTTDHHAPEVDVVSDGSSVVTWTSVDGNGGSGVFARRFSASGVGGPAVQVNTQTALYHSSSTVAVNAAGNFVVAWYWTNRGQVPWGDVRAQRYAGGIAAHAMAVDAAASGTSDGNRVFEAGETVTVAPSWLNAGLTPQSFTGAASGFTGPGGAIYSIVDGTANYGTAPAGATAACATSGDCYALGASLPATRPATHWDAAFHEDIAPAALGATKLWTLHVGDSFSDVPRSNAFYRFVETLLHRGVTSGCTPSAYCPALATSRDQMAVFVLVAKEGPGYVPPACTTPVFADVPASNPYCRWIEDLARRAVVNGCGGGLYCPLLRVSREEMAVFVLRTLDPGLSPPACATPRFADVPASSGYCRWIEELARRAVVAGCGGGNYCPTGTVTRDQMGVFISAGFSLALYGP